MTQPTEFRRNLNLSTSTPHGATGPGSLRPGWRAPLCGGVFRVVRGRVCSSAVEHPYPGAVVGSSPIRSTMRIAQLVEHETVNLAVLGSIPKSHSLCTRDSYTGSRLLPQLRAHRPSGEERAANDGEAPRPSRIPLRCKTRARTPERSRCCNLVSTAARRSSSGGPQHRCGAATGNLFCL